LIDRTKRSAKAFKFGLRGGMRTTDVPAASSVSRKRAV